MSNMIIKILAISFVVSGTLHSQVKENEESVPVTVLSAQKITIEPPKAQIALKIKDVKPREYDFFRSFEDEVKSIPRDILNVQVYTVEHRIDNFDELLKKERK